MFQFKTAEPVEALYRQAHFFLETSTSTELSLLGMFKFKTAESVEAIYR
jgi:hypothetical protein